MKENEDSHVHVFKSTKLKPQERVELHLQGWIGEIMGSGDKRQHNGQFILTNERACFYRKGFLGEVLETIPLSKITSVETQSFMGYRVLKLHTSHDELAFKTFEAKGLFDRVYARLEEIRHAPLGNGKLPSDQIGSASSNSGAVIEQLKKLADLKATGVLTDDEFNQAKAQLLAKL